jgi:2,4-dienoyl-CoA reductase-like NADH-dependent reductase (Old Yellow Enzyme family)
MAHLFSPLKIKGIELKNRIVVSPMCQYSAVDGFPNQWHTVHYGTRAVSGAGLVMTEGTAVSSEGRITHGDLGLWSDEQIPYFKEIVDFIHENGAIAGIQLSHAGRKGSHAQPWLGGAQIFSNEVNGWETYAPSPIPWGENKEAPIELDLTGIAKVKADYRSAIIRAHKAGFKVLAFHFAHGYLAHEFLSPLSNFRTDEYGGSFENRIRLLLEIIEDAKEVWPADLPIFVKISATEWIEGGWDENDSVALAKILKDKGVDLVDCSSGGNIAHAKIPAVPGYQVAFAEAVRKTGVLTGAVGLITTPQQANAVIESDQADLVSLARQLLRDPYFPLRAAYELGHEVKWPVQYERAKWN